ncbi:DUF3006 domain-containing protein [Oceanobacillus neutriphilus]|uniref:DUF3006 domain-containing protein n=1 Tax=Oceanobacillus neutriphilus TaxID=531815 RepID=A0ABQ2NP12_9BACI|nr:DUF3006 domain-containing protein [Oceanobacillus neutriphilus]GGP07192.1 hypothetical protein GCM10011346_02190 [Oceanobacillus neutriphilus]
MKGIIDRFEGETAVILVEAESREILISSSELPEECTVKSVVRIEESEEHTHPRITLDTEADQENKQQSGDLRKALLKRKKSSKLRRRK